MAQPSDAVLERRKVLTIALLILALAAALRFINIGWSFSNDGIDEGIMLERSYMVGLGHELYSDLPCDQAPLAFYMGALFDGDVLALRSMSAMFSLVAIAACMLAARSISGQRAMLATGLLLAVDFAFLRESRLFSLDALAGSMTAISIPFFVLYLRRGSRLMLFCSGLLVGLALVTKLFGGLALVGMLVFLIVDAWGRKERRARLLDIALLLVAASLPMLRLLIALGPSDMIQGMLLDQGHRAFDAEMKLSVLAYFGLLPVYALPLAYARTMWGMGREVRYLLSTSLVILAFMILQPLVFFHHMVLLSPFLAVLAGVLAVRVISLEKGLAGTRRPIISFGKVSTAGKAFSALFLASLLASAGLAAYGLGAQGEPIQQRLADMVEQRSDPGEFVITGDPLIAAIAERPTPPEVVNVAYRVDPELTLQDVEDAIDAYEVKVVVVCYKLSDMAGLQAALESRGFHQAVGSFIAGDDSAVLDLFQEGIGPISFYWRE